jgi:hypothetical protein
VREIDIGALVDRSLTVVGRGRKNAGRLEARTLKQYRRSWNEAQKWLTSVGLSTVTAWSSETLAQYAGVLLENGYAVSTVDHRLAGVKAEHRKRGWPVPDGVAAWYVLRGAKNTALSGVKVNTPRPRRAALADAAAHLDPLRPAGARDLCLATLGWDLMAQVKSLVDIDLADVRTLVDEHGEMSLSVRVDGRWLPVVHLHEPVDVCPVEATQAWIGTLYTHGVHHGPLFRGVDKGGNIAGEPAGKYAGHPTALRLTARGVQRIWSTIVVKGQMPPSTPRDLRFASSLEAAAAGVPLRWILNRGGWSPTGHVRARLEDAAMAAGTGEDA